MPKPMIAIVGRPNVGKSALFNKLIGQRLSIVEDTPGVTRDRIYGEADWNGRKFTLIDTGGIEPRTDSEILTFMREQAGIAIRHADVIVFLTDIKTGLTASDQEVANMLQKSGKPIVLGTVDLSTVEDGQELNFPIPLADELTNISGVTEVRATISLNKRLVTKTFEAVSIQTANVPEGWEADVVTQVVQVKVRGSQTLMDQLNEENILVIADLEDIKQVAGQYTVPATIRLGSSGTSSEIGVMASDYSVVVNLRPSGG